MTTNPTANQTVSINTRIDDALKDAGITEHGPFWAFAERQYPTVAGPFQTRGAIGLSALSWWRLVLVELDAGGRSVVLAEPVPDRPGESLRVVRTLTADEANGLINATHLPYTDRVEHATSPR